MTHLRIENENSNVEIVSNSLILKLYTISSDIEQNLEEKNLLNVLNQLEEEPLSDYVTLKGNLLVDKCKESTYNYLTGNLPDSDNKRFPNLSINVTLGLYLNLDPVVESVLMGLNIGDGTGIILSDLGNVNTVSNWFKENTNLLNFDELFYTNVTLIGELAFARCTNLESINLSKITTFQRGAFNGCSSLTFVDLSSATSILGNYSNGGAFLDCTSLTNISAPLFTGQVNLYESLLFLGCTGLTTVDFSSCTRIPNSCFSRCASLTTIKIPSSPVTVVDYAFSGCTSLANIGPNTNQVGTDLSGVTYIGAGAFKNCSSLISIDLSSLTTVGGDSTNNGAFNGCTGLTTVTNLNKTGLYMFYSCTGLTSVGLTLNCTSVARNAFNGCTLLSNIDLSHVTTFGVLAFKGCISLLSIDLSSCTALPEYPGEVFLGCTSLTTITGLSNIDAKDLGFATFSGCSSLGLNQDLVLNSTKSGELPANTFIGTGYKSVTVNAPNITNMFNYSGSGVSCMFKGMSNVIKMDLSNTAITYVSGPTLASLQTLILPSTLINISWGFTDMLNSNTLYIVLLATTPPTIETDTYFNLRNANIYVPDTSLSTYLAAQYWSGNKILSHLKPLSELPVGVWKTGLYQLYEPYLSNSTDPAYATT